MSISLLFKEEVQNELLHVISPKAPYLAVTVQTTRSFAFN